MQLFSLFAIYFVVWWLCLFLVLPFGNRSQHESGDVAPGTDPGAPVLANIWWKILATTILAAIVTALAMWALSNPLLREYWAV